jgi:hypothetical protein
MPALNQSGGADPGEDAEEVTPHNTNELGYVSRALYVGGAGDLTVLMLNDQVVTFSAVPAGSLLPIRVKRVNSTGTTATAIVSIY